MPPRWHALEQPRFAESDGGTEPDNADGQRCRPAEISEAGADSAGDPNALTAIRSCKSRGIKHGADVRMPDLLETLTGCPKAGSASFYDRCKAIYEKPVLDGG